MRLKILSWNVWIDGYFDQIAELLKNSNADIIGLQEVQADDPGRDVIGFLTGLGYEHVFAPVPKKAQKEGERDVNDGPALFSRHGILSSRIHTLSEVGARRAVQAEIQVGSTTLHAFSTHLLHTHQRESEVQDEQAKNLTKVLPGERTVLLGDFNATSDSNTIKRMREVLTDTDPSDTPTWSVYPEGCTECNPQAIDTRLDYIFTSRDIRSDSFKVESSKGSDHLPISVMIEI